VSPGRRGDARRLPRRTHRARDPQRE
jgi:hypothetical protein